MSAPESAPRAASPPPAGGFLDRVRQRLVLSDLLGAAAFAAAVNEALRWSAAAAVVYLGWNVPVFGYLGLLVFAALVPAAVRRWTPAAAAARVDARLGLSDRLASLVDFRGRREIPEPLRRAQADETSRALAGATPAAAVPISRWRKAGPAVLAFCMVYQFLIPPRASRFSPLVSVVVPVWRLPAPGDTVPTGEPAAERGATVQPPPEKTGSGPADPGPAAESAKAHGEGAADQKAAERTDGARVEPETKLTEGDSGKTGDRTHPEQAAGKRDPQAPERIESERVGTRLARVVDPLYRPGVGRAPASLPAGVTTFHLLPQTGKSGAGSGAGGEGVDPTPVRVDLDAVPAPYRPIVRAYFEQLARAAAPAGGNPEP